MIYYPRGAIHMEKKKKNNVVKQIPIFLVFLFVGVLFGVFLATQELKIAQPFWWVVVSILISFFLVINIHEFGHFIVGKILGYSLLSFRIGIFSFDNINGKMKLTIKKNKGYSGLCAMISNDDSMNKFAFYIAGGILINFLTGILSLVVGIAINQSHNFLSILLIYLGFLSLAVFVINGIPLTKNNAITDGTFLYNIILKKPYAHTLSTLIKAQTMIAAGTRPRELNIEIDKEAEFDLFSYLYAYYSAQDAEELETTKYLIEQIEKNIDKANSFNLPAICYEICFCACIFGDNEKAVDFYDRVSKTLQKDNDINGLRVKAYYAYYINNDSEKAKNLCNEGLKVKDKYPIIGIAVYEENLINKLLDII